MSSWGLSKYVETKLQTTCVLPHVRLIQKVRNLSSYLILRMILEEKYFCCYIVLTDHV